jgi:uncharacterized protein YutE (UPF0331/DUF86 family)
MTPSKSAEAIIEEAVRRGEFENLAGAGKPEDLSAYFDTPEEVRLAYSILKNADVLPREADLLKEIAALKEQLVPSTDEIRKKEISKAIQERLLSYNLMTEKRKNGERR